MNISVSYDLKHELPKEKPSEFCGCIIAVDFGNGIEIMHGVYCSSRHQFYDGNGGSFDEEYARAWTYDHEYKLVLK